MLKLFAVVVLGAILSAAGANRDEDPARCAPVTPDIDSLVSYVKYLATRSDTAGVEKRKMYALPATAAESVSNIRDEAICTLAALAYDASLPAEHRVLDRQVFVIKAGPVYLVGDPVHRGPGEFDLVMVFDVTFTKVLARVMS